MSLSPDDDLRARFLIAKEHYLESMECGDVVEGLRCLRDDIGQGCQGIDPDLVHALAALVVCPGATELRTAAGWPGHASTRSSTSTSTSTCEEHITSTTTTTTASSAPNAVAVNEANGDNAGGSAATAAGASLGRNSLLADLEGFLSSSFRVPERRLESLLAQALDMQVWHGPDNSAAATSPFPLSPYSTGTGMGMGMGTGMPVSQQMPSQPLPVSLLDDFSCDDALLRVPQVARAVLVGHTDEVWLVRFSPDGAMLATASKDETVIIWTVDFPASLSSSSSASASSSSASLSSSVTTPAVAPAVSVAPAVRRVATLKDHKSPVTCLAWSPDGEHIVCGTAAGAVVRAMYSAV